jgi:quercetin dioxygenase-like cupin family protein
VLKGKVKFTTDEGETVIDAGDAYYIPPGHLPYLYAGTEVIEFSPTTELNETLAVIEKNMASA